MSKLEKLKNEQADMIKNARKIWDKQYSEDRELTEEEYTKYRKIMQKVESLRTKIKEEEKLQMLEVNVDADNVNLDNEENDKNMNENKNEEKFENHRAWIMGVHEIKKDEPENKEVKENKGDKGEKLSSEEPKEEKSKEELLAAAKQDENGNTRGRYSLLSRLNKQKERNDAEAKELHGSEKSRTKSKPKPEKEKPEKNEVKSSGEDPFRDIKNRLHRALIDEIDKKNLQELNEDEDLEDEVIETIKSLLDQEENSLSSKDKEKIQEEIFNEALGFGPITPLIEDENITEIMVNGPEQVYVEKEGKLKHTDIKFRDDQHVLHVIEKIVAPLGRRIDESSPMVDARLPDGSRVNAIIPPLSLTGPTITIRKFSEDPLKAKDLISFGSMSTEMTDFLKTCVKKRLNIIVSGGTGSGKTTTLNVLSSFIPSDERIVTIEDAAELTLHQDHVVTLETRPPNMEGKGAITMRDLVRNSLRMRPDRIVVGEVRGGEALDMLQAMNTGHDGSLTTGHANSPRDMLSRLETMVLMAGMDLPIRAIREQIASAIDLIVQQDRLEDGSRKVVKISEVQGMEGDVITMQDLFLFKREGRDSKNKIVGKFESTGFSSVFLESLEK